METVTHIKDVFLEGGNNIKSYTVDTTITYRMPSFFFKCTWECNGESPAGFPTKRARISLLINAVFIYTSDIDSKNIVRNPKSLLRMHSRSPGQDLAMECLKTAHLSLRLIKYLWHKCVPKYAIFKDGSLTLISKV